jgi:hypothetical protein
MVEPLLLGPILVACAAPLATADPDDGASAAAPRTPPCFVENRGQFAPEVELLASLADTQLLVRDDGFTLRALAGGDESGVRGVNIAFTVRDAATTPATERTTSTHGARGIAPTGALHHYFRGNDPARHVTHVPSYASARVDSVAPGIDLVLRHVASESSGSTPAFVPGVPHFEYDLELAPGADLAALVIDVLGVDAIALLPDGSLLLATPFGELRQAPPRSFTVAADGTRREVDTPLRQLGARSFGFVATEPLDGAALTIDPGLVFCSFFGGTLADRAYDIVRAADGSATIVGRGLSLDLPTTPGAFDTTYNGDSPSPEAIGDCWVARFAPDGATLQWSTYVGGALNDHAQELEIAADGDVVLSGWTISTDFPTTAGCFDSTFNGGGGGPYLGGDVYVTRLADDGAALVASTYLGGSDLEYAIGLGLAADESVHVTGHVHSKDFPTTPGAWQEDTTDHAEIFVSRLSSDLATLVASTYFGGNAEEYSDVLLVSADGTITIAGGTNSSNLPTTPGAVDSTYDGGDTSSHRLEGFVARFDALLTTVTACTYLGRSATDAIYGGALHPDGSLLFCGDTRSADFPVTSGAFQTVHGGGFDGFIVKLASDLTAIDWCTFLGGEADDRVSAVVPRRSGHLIFGGRSFSTGWPTTPGCFDATRDGAPDAVAGALDRDGSQLHYSTFMGGLYYDALHDAVPDARAGVLLTGETSSGGFPATAGAFDTTYNSKVDGWAAWCDLLPTGAVRYGDSTDGCDGPITIAIDRMAVGGGDAVIACENGPALGSGWLAVSFDALSAPLSIAGVDVWVDPASSFFVLLPAVAESSGYSEFELHAGHGLVGLAVALQWFWTDACGPQGFTASDALEVTVQP